MEFFFFFFSSRRRHTRWNCDWSSDVCSSDLAEHEGIDGTDLTDAFRRVFSEGPAVGITFVVTADRVGALPLRLASLVSQKLLLRLADASDYSMLGLRAAQLPRFVSGRAVHSEGNRVVQVGLPGDLTTI